MSLSSTFTSMNVFSLVARCLLYRHDTDERQSRVVGTFICTVQASITGMRCGLPEAQQVSILGHLWQVCMYVDLLMAEAGRVGQVVNVECKHC
jgi:hypothetical protein